METCVTDHPRSRALLSRHTSRLLIVDVQAKLVRVMSNADHVINACRRLLEGARLLGIPADATEQYPNGLGATVEALGGLVNAPTAKMRFSAVPSLDWMNDVTHGGRHQFVLAGLETHVCILQTALDLIARGFDVSIPADAVDARTPLDHEIALERLRSEGCVITTWESVLFEWCETAEAAEFKSISRLVVEQTLPSA